MSTNTLSLHQIWWLTLTSPQISFQTQARGYLNPTSLHAGSKNPIHLKKTGALPIDYPFISRLPVWLTTVPTVIIWSVIIVNMPVVPA